MINVIDFNPVDDSTQDESDVILSDFLDPGNIYKLRLKTFRAKKGGSGSTEVLPKINISQIFVQGIRKNGETFTAKMLRSNHDLGLFLIDFGEVLTQVQLIITLDSTFSLPLASGNNPFSAIIETNESILDSKIPFCIAKRTCANAFITTKSVIKICTITADSGNADDITIQGYNLSENDGGASFNMSIGPGQSETFIGSMTCITVVPASGLVTDFSYKVNGYRE